MRYKLLGRSGLRVSELCLGTMTFGDTWGWGASKDECRKMFDAFANVGGNFIDTANHYTNGISERYVGEFIGKDRERFVVATKYTLNGRPTDPNGGGSHRKNLVQSLDASLHRLGVDYIDLYWVHAWDPLTPTEEVMRALDDVVRAGKVLYIGVSDTPAWVVARANAIADARGWTPFTALQLPYSLIERTPERELLPMAKALDIAVTPWGVMGSGLLSGKYEHGARPDGDRLTVTPWGAVTLTERNHAIAAEAIAIAQEIGCTPSQVAVAWVTKQPWGVVIPILGAKRVEQLVDNLGGLQVPLDAAHLQRLNAASSIDLGFPSDFLANADNFIYGETRRLIDDHRQ